MDTLFINELRLPVSIGIHPEEKLAKQDLLLTVQLSLDLEKAKRSDEIEDTLNYDLLVLRLNEIAEKKHYNLIEHFAYSCQQEILSQFLMVKGCKIRVEKPTALSQARSSAVEIG